MSMETTAIKATLMSLAGAPGPDRALDAEIAKILGWRSEPEEYTDRAGETQTRHNWFNDEGVLDKVPRFTWSLDVALGLIHRFSQTIDGGFGWERGQASASFGSNKPMLAKTPEIAICMQALMLRLRQLEA